MSNSKKPAQTSGKSAQKLHETALSEKELAQAAGGFNPQPEPPGDLQAKARLTPSDLVIRVRPIGG